jgi:hypothetical protein
VGQAGLFGEEIQVDQTVSLGEENGLVVGTALRDVVRHTGRDDSGSPRHMSR